MIEKRGEERIGNDLESGKEKEEEAEEVRH